MSARISNTYACCGVTATPSRASRAAGATSSDSGARPNRARRLADPGRHAVGADRGGADVEHLDRVAERHGDRDQLGRVRGRVRPPRARAPRRRSRAAPGGSPGVHDEHVAAGPEPGQQRLARERGEHRGERRVDGVAAGPQRVGARLRGQRMPRGDDAELRLGHARGLPARDEFRYVEIDHGARRALTQPADARLAGRLGLAAPATPCASRRRSTALERTPATCADRRSRWPRPSPTPGRRASRRPSRRR